MVILSVNLEVPGEMFDALTQQRDLHFRRAGVRLMNPELFDLTLFLLSSESHGSALILSFFPFYV